MVFSDVSPEELPLVLDYVACHQEVKVESDRPGRYKITLPWREAQYEGEAKPVNSGPFGNQLMMLTELDRDSELVKRYQARRT